MYGFDRFCIILVLF